MLASFLAALSGTFHVFAYLNGHDWSQLVMDPSYDHHGEEPSGDWAAFYPDVKEEIPVDALPPCGKNVQITCFVNVDHAGDLVTRRSRTGVLIYLNQAPISWYSKKQNSVEMSTFGSEFMVLKIAIEQIKGIQYKPRMMGIPIDGHAHVCNDNMSVIVNSTRPKLTLKKKSNVIAYHFMCERDMKDCI